MKHEKILAPSMTATAAHPTVVELLVLARQYGSAARSLRALGKSQGWAPFRFCLLHSIELTLSALLLNGGHDWRKIKDIGHDLARRAELGADGLGLKLRKNSIRTLERIRREQLYRGVRYSGTGNGRDLPPSQLEALFADVTSKVCELIAKDLAHPPDCKARN